MAADLLSRLAGEFNGIEFVFDDKGQQRRYTVLCVNTPDADDGTVRSLHIRHDPNADSSVTHLLVFGIAEGGTAYMHRFDTNGTADVTGAIGSVDGDSVSFEQQSDRGRLAFTYRFTPDGYEYDADLFPAGEPVELVRGRLVRSTVSSKAA